MEMGHILLKRLTEMGPITEEYNRQHAEEDVTIEHWKKRIHEIESESPQIYDESSLRQVLHFY